MGEEPAEESILDKILDGIAQAYVNFRTDVWSGEMGLEPAYLDNTLFTLGILITIYVLRRFVVIPISQIFRTATTRYFVQKTGTGVLWVLGILSIGGLWGAGAGEEFFKFLAVIAAGLAIALTEPISNFAGWIVIMVARPFELKDRIQIGNDLKGDVIDISIFNFALLEVGNWVDADQSTGRIVHIPSATVFRKTISNYTQGFGYIWNEVAVMVTFESDWELAHQLLTDIAHRQSKEAGEKAAKEVRTTTTRFMVYYTRFTPIVWVKVADSGVVLTMRYLCEARRRRSSESEIWREVLRAFREESGIDFAYPTHRFYQNVHEGKPGTGGPPGPPVVELETLADEARRDEEEQRSDAVAQAIAAAIASEEADEEAVESATTEIRDVREVMEQMKKAQAEEDADDDGSGATDAPDESRPD